MNPPTTPIQLTHLAAARVSGEDAGEFLQAQFTADLTRLAVGDACFSAYCDRQGNVLAVIRVLRESDAYLLITSASLIEMLITTLSRYRLRARVEFERLEDPVIGQGSPAASAYAISTPAPVEDPGAAAQWRAMELRAGIPWLSPATSGQFLPQMLGLEGIGAVSFRKGCFPGQEVIARVRYLGKVKRLPTLVDLAGPIELAAGDEVTVVGESGPIGPATLVDHAFDGVRTAFFLVAMNPDATPVTALEIGGKRYPVAA